MTIRSKTYQFIILNFFIILISFFKQSFTGNRY